MNLKPNKIFLPLSWLFELIVFIKNNLYDNGIFRQNKFDLKIISVGNITVGGTGKTPMIELLAKYILSKNKKLAIISRGYKRISNDQIVVSDGKNILVSERISGDEPMQIAKKFKNSIVIVDKNRSKAIETAKYQFGAEVVLLDDAFQHRKVAKDCDLVLVDSTQTMNDMKMIPAGLARENISSLKRSSAIVITKCNSMKNRTEMIDKIRSVTKSVIFSTDEKIVSFFNVNKKMKMNLSSVKNKTALVICGIAQPEYFIQHLRNCGISILKIISFPDHYRFEEKDYKNILESIDEVNPKLLITTEKDFVRIENKDLTELIKKITFIYSNYEVSIKEEKSFYKFINGYIAN